MVDFPPPTLKDELPYWRHYSKAHPTINIFIFTTTILHNIYNFPNTPTLFRGALFRSTSRNFNGPKINVLHINCSLLQPRKVDVKVVPSVLYRKTALYINKNSLHREKKDKEKKRKCSKSKFLSICLRENFHREKKD